MRLWFSLFLLTCSLPICAQSAVAEVSGHHSPILVLTSQGELFDQARNGLENELSGEFSLSTIEIEKESPVAILEKVFSGFYQPRVVVLIGNNAIRLYTKFAGQHKELTAPIQIVTFLALDVQRAVSGLNNVQAIAYETPMVTAIVNFRRVINKQFSKVGVLYRAPFGEFIDKHTGYCKKENLIISGVMISDNETHRQKELGNGLRNLIKKDGVEVLWIPNDNILLKPELLKHVWLPIVNQYKIPVIVGVESLVNPELNFGTYAVIPDPQALGEQAAGIIVDLNENGWKHHGTNIYPAISMYSVLNLNKAVMITDEMDLRLNEVTKVVGSKKK